MERRQETRTEVVQREWLSYREAQEFCGLGRTVLWTLASTSQVKAAKVGKSVRFSRKSLQEFMERNAYAEAAE